MSFFPVNRNAPASNNVLELKSILVRGIAVAEQMQRETAQMTEAQMQSQYGITATAAQWDAVLSGTEQDPGVVLILQMAAVETYISSLG